MYPRTDLRVGPEGYVHGWIKAGPASAVVPKHARVTTAKGWIQPQIPTGERQRLKSEAQAARKRLSAPQLKTVEQWTSGKGMVRRIQTGKVSDATGEAFDQAMHEAPKVDGLVYRGVKPGSELAKLAERMRPGTTLRLDEPVSTSVDPGQASSFGTYMFEIESPAAAYVSGIGSKFAYEQEAVLAPGHFKVASVETVKMHFPGHGVYPVRVVKLQDVSQGERSWRHVDRSALKRSAAAGPDDGDRSDRFVQGDGPGAFYIVNGTQSQAGRAAGAVTNPAGTERLHEYWVHGEGAVKIGWGTPGDFDRCVMHLGKFIRDPKGYCNLAHHAALGIWPATHAKLINAGRTAGMTAEYRAVISTASQNDLPDDAFAYIEPGGSKDSGGKTTPRDKRHFPIHDAAHVRDALGRAPQSPFGEKAMPKIRAAAKKFGVQVSDSDSGRSAAAWGDLERRYTPSMVEARAVSDGDRIGGYGAVFGKLSRNLGGFVERVGDGAFNQARSLGWPNVVCRYNHDANMVLGTTAGGTLQLRTDNVGLDYEVIPPMARADILELVQRRDIQFSSFAFRVPQGGDEWSTTDQNYPMRTLHEVQLVDVAPVLDPAYPDATAGLRSLAAAMGADVEEVRSMAEADELRRFFTRSDRSSFQPPKPKVTGAAAMVKLMEKRRDPWA